MRKNKAMRAAGVLFIATMLTTCLTAGTLAKYTTGDSAGDSARVAKFGVQIVANGSLFGPEYKDKDGGNTPVFTATGNSITVDAIDKENVVAPGTKNDNGLGFAVTGKPEVDVKLDLEIKTENVFLAKGEYGVMVQKPEGAVTEDNFSNLNETFYTKTVDGENVTFAKAESFAANTTYYVLSDVNVKTDADYFPVVYALSGDTSEAGTTAADSAKAVAKKIAKQFDATATATADDSNAGKYTLTASKTVKANTDIAGASSLNLDSEKITWAWAFEKADGTDNEKAAVDNMDTILGDLADETVKTNVVKITRDTDNNITALAALTAGTDYNLTTGIEFTINATQVD